MTTIVLTKNMTYFSPIQISALKLFTELAKLQSYLRHKNDDLSCNSFMISRQCFENVLFANKLTDLEICLIVGNNRVMSTIDTIYDTHIADTSEDPINISDTVKKRFIKYYNTLREYTNENLLNMLDVLHDILMQVKSLVVKTLSQASLVEVSTRREQMVHRLSSGASKASDDAISPNIKQYIGLINTPMIIETGFVNIPDREPTQTQKYRYDIQTPLQPVVYVDLKLKNL